MNVVFLNDILKNAFEYTQQEASHLNSCHNCDSNCHLIIILMNSEADVMSKFYFRFSLFADISSADLP